MTLGLSISAFTMLHVAISLIGIASGIVVLQAMLSNKPSQAMTSLFLWSTVLTSVTGFMFPFGSLLPSHIFGVISLVVLAVAFIALYGSHLEGRWRSIYVISAMFALYLNSFVAVVQAFQKLGPLKAMAPTQSEPPFLIAQVALLAVFAALGWMAVKRFRPESETG